MSNYEIINQTIASLEKQGLTLKNLSKEKEKELIIAGRDHDDAKALKKLVSYHIRSAYLLAKKISPKYPRLDAEDIAQEAVTGIYSAINNFDLDKGLRLSTLANSHMRKAIQNFNMNCSKTIRLPSNLSKDIAATINSANKLGLKEPYTESNIQLLAAQKGIPPKKLQHCFSLQYVASMDAPFTNTTDGDESLNLHNIIVNNNAIDIEAEVDSRKSINAIQEILKTRPERETDMLIQRFFYEKCLSEIGIEYQITSERVRQILSQLEVVIIKHFKRKRMLPAY